MSYMPGTKFELKHWDSPDHMHRVMMLNDVALTWHASGDPDSPDHTESFDLADNYNPENNRTGMTRAECDQVTWDIYWEEQCK